MKLHSEGYVLPNNNPLSNGWDVSSKEFRFIFFNGDHEYAKVNDLVLKGYDERGAIGVEMKNDGPIGLVKENRNWMIIDVPYGESCYYKNEIDAVKASLSLQSVAEIVFGKYVIGINKFQNLVEIEDLNPEGPRKLDAYSKPLLLITHGRNAPVDNDSIARLSEVLKKITRLSDDDRVRVTLALRWYAKAHEFASNPIDSWLSKWVALEAISFDGGTDINVMINKLVKVSGYDSDQIRGKYKLPKLHGIRSNMVHGKSFTDISAELGELLDALFLDMFYFFLGMKTDHWISFIKKYPSYTPR